MITQRNVDKVRLDFFVDWDTAAKLHTVVKGKTMPAMTFKGRAKRKDTRKMSIGYYIEQLVLEGVKSVKPDAESLKWAAEGRMKAVEMRARQDEKVRSGANRKPKSEWKKPGRVAGKKYPKYEMAMKRVIAKRRASRNSDSKKTNRS